MSAYPDSTPTPPITTTNALMEAVHRRDVERVRLLVEAGASLETGTGRPLLHEAAEAGMLWLVERILATGVDINLRDEDGTTPLGAAAWGGRLAVVRWLLAKGADVAARISRGNLVGFGPLDLAAQRGAPGCVEALLAAGATHDPSVNVFKGLLADWRAEDDHRSHSPSHEALEAVAAVLARGSVEPSLERWKNQHGWAVVHALVSERPPELARSKPALLRAYCRDAEEVIHRMLDAGMDPTKELDLALRRRADAAAWFLGHPSVKPDLALQDMGSPMHGAAALGDAALLRRLLARGGDPSARAVGGGESATVKLGQTPLHALSSPSLEPPIEALEVLLAAGAEVNALDAAGQTPLDVVGFRAIRARLRAAGALGGREIAEAES